MSLENDIVELIRRTATELPEDVVVALNGAMGNENSAVGKDVLSKILGNVNIAGKESKPICQDTGTPIFYVTYPKDYSQEELRDTIEKALTKATDDVPLRPNAVDTLEDKNIGNRPVIHLEEGDELKIDLMLKGGGSENVSAVYQLPNLEIDAHRNLDGVRMCVLNSVFKAQGKGCPPYMIGVATGGSIEEVASSSKKQLLRRLDDKNENEELRKFEEKTLADINKLGIGPVGLGGKSTALSVKIATGIRHPATFFVGISFGCWCMRRGSL